jgi:glutaminyl-peptide cyclotransferase
MKRRATGAGARWAIAIAIMGAAVGLAYALQIGRTAPPPTPSSQTAVPRESPFSASRSQTDLSTLVGFGPRPAGSDALGKAREYIVAELRQAGLEPLVDEFEATTPRGRRKMANIRAIRKGNRADIIVLCGHYDTKVFDFSFVGADDGGSSAAWVLEMARATSGLKLENTMEFVFFDGEEAVVDWTETDSVYGSRHDVDRRVRGKELDRLKALILVDMIGDKNLNIKREPGSTRWLTDVIWNTAHQMKYQNEFLDASLPVEDDHFPYLHARVNAVDLIDFDYPYWHTAADTLDKVSGASLKIVGDVVYNSLPEIDRRVSKGE